MDIKKTNKQSKIRAKNSEKILQAAELEFVKHGYKGTSIQLIADAAGLPKANLLYYFKNKANLYNTLLEGIVHQWDKFFTDITEEDDPTESLERYIRIKVEHALNYPNASKIFATEIIQGAPNINDKLRQYVGNNLKNKCKVIESWIAQGKMNKIDPHHLFFLIWSSTQYYADFETQVLLITDKHSYQAEDIEKISHFLCQMILSGCGLTPSYKSI